MVLLRDYCAVALILARRFLDGRPGLGAEEAMTEEGLRRVRSASWPRGRPSPALPAPGRRTPAQDRGRPGSCGSPPAMEGRAGRLEGGPPPGRCRRCSASGARLWPMFKTTVHPSPARLKAAAFQHLLLEAEFTFAFREGIPLRARPYAREEVLEAVEAVIPSIELMARGSSASASTTRRSPSPTSPAMPPPCGPALPRLARARPCRAGAAMIIGGVHGRRPPAR